MSNDKFITPRKLNGFWELMPKEQILFSQMLATIEGVFKTNCFLPLDTPVLEYSEVLLAKSGGDTDKEVYRLIKGDTDMCMRYDLTVPLSRFVAMHQNELNFPFKRYQIGKVYRGERPQKGRFREFYQCDADIIGNESLPMVADAECVYLYEKCFEALNLKTNVHISNRKILAGYIEELDKTKVSNDIFIVLDKLNKISLETAISMLNELGLTEQESQNLIKLTKMCGNFEEIKQNLCNFSKNDLFLQGLSELEEVANAIKLMGVKNAIFDLSIIRGHNYYTGTVFEAFLKNEETSIAIGGGGRYDNLCGFFSEKKMPGVGMSIGITRLFDLLLKSDYFSQKQTNEVECAIITFDETFDFGLTLLAQLRNNDIKAECLYASKSFKNKMKEANRRQIKYVLIIGEDEVNSKIYTLKDMETSEQFKLTLQEVAEKIKSDRMCN